MSDKQRQDELNANCVRALRNLAEWIERGEIHVEQSDAEVEIDDITQPHDYYQRKEYTGRQWRGLTVMDKAQNERFIRALAGERLGG